MAHLDVFDYAPAGGYLLDVQCDYLGRLSTRVVVPLLPEHAAPPPASDLNPVFEIAGTRYVMMTQWMAAVAAGELQDKAGSLARERDRIVKALDMVFIGF